MQIRKSASQRELYGEWLALLRFKLSIMLHIAICRPTCLGPLLNCQCCFKFWGCGHYKKTLMQKDVGMECQKVCKQGRDDA